MEDLERPFKLFFTVHSSSAAENRLGVYVEAHKAVPPDSPSLPPIGLLGDPAYLTSPPYSGDTYERGTACQLSVFGSRNVAIAGWK